MTSVPELVKECRRLGRVETDDLALRWLRAAVSVLSDWGGEAAVRALKSGVPGGLFSGPGTKGLTFAQAKALAAGSPPSVTLYGELGRRAGQEDPGKVAQMGAPALGLIKQQLAADQVQALLAALPAEIAPEVSEASVKPPWGFFLIPQSYARPAKKRAH